MFLIDIYLTLAKGFHMDTSIYWHSNIFVIKYIGTFRGLLTGIFAYRDWSNILLWGAGTRDRAEHTNRRVLPRGL